MDLILIPYFNDGSFVYDVISSDRIPVNIRLELSGMECKYLGVDIQDEHGRHEVGYMENTKKDPINGGRGKFQVHKTLGHRYKDQFF